VPSRGGEVLDFWFGQEGDPEYGQFRNEWFRKDPEFDARVTRQFADLYQEAAAGNLDGWREEAESCLALVIVLDQFPRNMFRGDGRTHAEDDRALVASKYAIEHTLDRELRAFQRMFLYMPFMHSENVEDQGRSVELFERLAGEAGAPDVVSYAVAHRDIVVRFGRFPHRNEILGRKTTPEEAVFLTTEGSSF
jgi:uncharacterized protein (DUF924 family)